MKVFSFIGHSIDQSLFYLKGGYFSAMKSANWSKNNKTVNNNNFFFINTPIYAHLLNLIIVCTIINYIGSVYKG